MNHARNASRFRTLALASILMLAGTSAPLALADDAKPADAAATNDDALKGPEVKDRNVPGSRSSFGGPGSGGGDRRRDGAGGPMVMLRVLRSLGSDEAPENVRASPEQADEIRDIIEEFRDEQKAFRDEHQAQIKSLREKAGLPANEMRRAGGPDAPPPAEGDENADAPRGRDKQGRKQQRAEATPEQQQARQELKALMDKGPKFDAYQARIWEALSTEQQAYVKERVEAIKANPEQMRGRSGPGGPEGGDRRPGKGARKQQRKAPSTEDDMMSPTPPPSEEE